MMSDRVRLAIAAAVAGALALTPVVLGAMRSRSAAGGGDARPPAEEHVHFVAFSPGSGERMYIGTHGGLSVVSLGGGGREGAEVRSLEGRDVMNIAFDLGRPGRVVVGGHDLLSASDDGGRTWRPLRAGLPGYDIHGLTGTARPGRLVAYVVGQGVFRSEDGGSTWERLGDGPPSERVISLMADPRDEDLLYAGDLAAGVFRSEDGGRTWVEAAEGLADRSVMALAVAPGDPATVYAATAGGVFRSDDGGRRWQAGAGLPPGPAYAVAAHPARPGEVYALAAGGWYVSRDGGRSWSPVR